MSENQLKIPPYPHRYNINLGNAIHDEISALESVWAVFDLDIYQPRLSMYDLLDEHTVQDYARVILTDKHHMTFDPALFTWIMHPGIIAIDFYGDKNQQTHLIVSLLPNQYPTITTCDMASEIYLHKKFLPMWTQHLASIFN